MFAGWHILDIFFILLASYFVIKGCLRGFVGEILTLVGFISSIYLAFNFSATFGNMLEQAVGMNTYIAKFVAILILWFCVAVLVTVIRSMLKRVLSTVNMGAMDKLLGIFSGILKTIFVVYLVLVLGFLLSPIANPNWMTSSDVLRYSGRHWPLVRQALIDFELMPKSSIIPNGTLEEVLRPYRTGEAFPKKRVEQ